MAPADVPTPAADGWRHRSPAASGPLLFAVVRQRAGGRITFTTPLWADARGYLVGLLEQHAAEAVAAAEPDVARRARGAAEQVPVAPPARDWSVRVGGCRYGLGHQDLSPAPIPAESGQARATGVSASPAGLAPASAYQEGARPDVP